MNELRLDTGVEVRARTEIKTANHPTRMPYQFNDSISMFKIEEVLSIKKSENILNQNGMGMRTPSNSIPLHQSKKVTLIPSKFHHT